MQGLVLTIDRLACQLAQAEAAIVDRDRHIRELQEQLAEQELQRAATPPPISDVDHNCGG